jgi:hypothetical protein
VSTALEELEQKTFEEDDSPESPPADIVAYNELRRTERLAETGPKSAQTTFEVRL